MVEPHHDHGQFLALIARLRAVAEKHGDTAFAEGLAACLIDASGGHAKCPMAKLFIDEYAATGALPKVEDTRTRPLQPMTTSDPPPYERRSLINHIQRALEEKAIVRRDLRLLEALHGCEKTRTTDVRCPLYQLLADV
jgi:hypothetical protein